MLPEKPSIPYKLRLFPTLLVDGLREIHKEPGVSNAAPFTKDEIKLLFGLSKIVNAFLARHAKGQKAKK